MLLSDPAPATFGHAALDEVRLRIAHAAVLAGRDPADVELIAISKTQPIEATTPLIAAGQASFGENRVQEAAAKWADLPGRAALRLHLVGQLQSNKADEAVRLFDAIHSVDRLSLIDALAKAVERGGGRRPDCFLQVNIGEEAQKGGCAIDALPGLLRSAADAGLAISGLMCVPPADTEAAPYFALLAKLARDHGLTGLSMGMSGDYETAVMLGATHVRVGTALFGARA
jgi:pyridoxal phosphate enzyme (YggS family)